MSVETVREKVAETRTAQEIFSTYSQEQVDQICRSVARTAIQNRILLAQMAMQETQMGILEDKILKNHYAAELVYHQYRHTKTCGVIEMDEANGTRKIAAPVGVVGSVLPVTNPTSTAIFQILLCLKTRNALILSPHPKVEKCAAATVKICAKAAEEAGAPAGVIQCLEAPKMELTQALIKAVDLVIATGGTKMVQAAYASGKPAIGAGGGNCPVILHESADLNHAISAIVHSKTFDAGLLCSSEQAVIVGGKENMEPVKRAFEKWGGYVLSMEETIALRELFSAQRQQNMSSMAGKKAEFIARSAGLDVPENTKLLLAPVSEISLDEPLAQEKLCPVLALYQAETFFQALDMAEQLLALGGQGHTAGLHIHPLERKDQALWRERMKSCRLVINSPTAQGAIGGLYNALPPALTLGCGSWGGSNLSGNLEPRHLLNIKTVACGQAWPLAFRLPPRIYHEKGCTSWALSELREHDQYQTVFLVTDRYLYQHGAVASVLAQLEQMGVKYTTDYAVTPPLTERQISAGVAAMEQVQPDAIIGLGGGSVLDGAKLMRYAYEHPDVPLVELRADFLDQKKQVFSSPKSDKKVAFFAIPTIGGTGAENSPYAVLSQDGDGIPQILYDQELLPTAVIWDVYHMAYLPKGLTRACGMEILTSAMEAYASRYATDYTDGFALLACKRVLQWLPSVYDKLEQEVRGREKLVDAAALAGMAMGNTGPGLTCAMALALSAWHHLPYGVACGILLPEVLEYRARKMPEPWGNGPQRVQPDLQERYQTMARFCGYGGDTEGAFFENLLQHVRTLRNKVEVYPTIQAYGVEEAYFLQTLDRMTEVAWNYPWTAHNLENSRIAEIRSLYLRCYYGEVRESVEIE